MSILVCDDHQMFLSALVEALESQGHEVAAYTPDPNRILELAALHHPALVLLDVQMPGMTGIELARRLREQDPRIAILLLTASTEDWVRAAFDARAVDGLVRKQSGLQALDAAIRRVLAGERTAVDWPLPDPPDRAHRVPAGRADRPRAPGPLDADRGRLDDRDGRAALRLDQHGAQPCPQRPAQAGRPPPDQGRACRPRAGTHRHGLTIRTAPRPAARGRCRC